MRLRTEGLIDEATARAGSITRDVLALTAAALAAGRHVVLLEHEKRPAELVVNLIAERAADDGLCFGAVSITAHPARLLTPSNVLIGPVHNDFWWFVRRANDDALRLLVRYVRGRRTRSNWRVFVSTRMDYRAVASIVTDGGRSDFALIDVEDVQ